MMETKSASSQLWGLALGLHRTLTHTHISLLHFISSIICQGYLEDRKQDISRGRSEAARRPFSRCHSAFWSWIFFTLFFCFAFFTRDVGRTLAFLMEVVADEMNEGESCWRTAELLPRILLVLKVDKTEAGHNFYLKSWWYDDKIKHGWKINK